MVLTCTIAGGDLPRDAPVGGSIIALAGPELVFVPEPVLATTPLDELPIGRTSRDSIERLVDMKRRPERWGHLFSDKSVPDCHIRFHAPPPAGSAMGADSLLEKVLEKEIVVAGQVVASVAGWDSWMVSIAELFVIQVDEVLVDRSDALGLEVGARIGLLLRGGRVRVHGTEICQRPVPGFYRPIVGDRVLVSGTPRAAAEGLPMLVSQPVFPVHEDGIRYQPYADVLPQEERTVDMETLRSEATKLVDP